MEERETIGRWMLSLMEERESREVDVVVDGGERVGRWMLSLMEERES